MPIPLAAAAVVALPLLGNVGGKLKGNDAALIIGGLAALWLINKIPTIPSIPSLNPKIKEGIGGFMEGEPDPIYLDQEGLSPNPPTEEWYSEFGDIQPGHWHDAGDYELERPPIVVIDGMTVPTPPVIGIPQVTYAEGVGINLRETFTPKGFWDRLKWDLSFGRWGDNPNLLPHEREVINAYQ